MTDRALPPDRGVRPDGRKRPATVSLIATVRNEADTLRAFLDALLRQTRAPDEIILSDGGSTDGTAGLIQDYADRGAPLHLLRAPGANIARGRNLAIARARGEIIACTDAGCRADPRWLEQITAPFADPGVDVACGLSRADARTPAERSLGILLTPRERDVDIRTYSPSSRCVAFRKTAWEAAGGYPEGLPWAEDTLFNRRLRLNRARFVLCPEARVFWRPPPTLRAAARTCFRYGLGDGLARLRPGDPLRILAKVSAFLGLALGGLWAPWAWAVLFLLLSAWGLRVFRMDRHRGSAAVLARACLYRAVLEPARLCGYALGRIAKPRA